jgi:hypothetical protein
VSPIHIQLDALLVCIGDGDFRLSLGQLCARLRQLTLRLRQPPFSLIQLCLKRPGIDLEKHLPLADEGAFGIFLFHEITGNLSLNFRIDQTIDGADPFAVQRDILLLDVGDQDFERLGRRRDAVGVATCRRAQEHRARH